MDGDAQRDHLEFRILGPLEVVRDGHSLSLGGPKQRALLSLLLMHPNEVVSVDRLIDGLWGERLPASPMTALQIHVSRLRGVLGEDLLETWPAGYRLRLQPGQLDLDRFRELVDEARRAAPDNSTRGMAALRDALRLWRGSPLADLADEPLARIEISRLEELRLAAVEERIEIDLAHGRARAAIAELEALVREHPFRERLRAQLMRALYQSGRQGDALRMYREARRTFSDELGLEPSPALKALERAILRHDRSLLRRDSELEGPPDLGSLRERLSVGGRAAARRHLEHYLELAEQADAQFGGPEGAFWLEHMAAETDGFRSALAFARDGGEPELELRLAAAYGHFCTLRGHLGEGRRWLEQALLRSRPLPASLVARALRGASILARLQGDYDAADRFSGKALDLYRASDDALGVAATLWDVGDVAARRGELERAAQAHTKGIALFEAGGEEIGAARLIAELSEVAVLQGEYSRAESLADEAAARQRASGDEHGLAMALVDLGLSAFHQGRLRTARKRLEESLALFHKRADPFGVARLLEALAAVDAASGDGEGAALLLGAAEALFEGVSAAMCATEAALHTTTVAQAREQAGRESYRAARAAGRELRPAKAVAYALGAGPAT